MAFKYTGRANTLNFKGKIYTTPDNYAAHPGLYDGSFDKPIPGMTQEIAVGLASRSNLHSFETTEGEDLLDRVTTPTIEGVDASVVRPEDLKKEAKK